ncbi:DEAD/DEAH box helicase [Geobacter hydrogenophilus]|uniref:Helicase n=1 Tax=Geobacter hydrogenophilus TaxID=40983 RepID=A0A9W6FZ47_9BACT|nr:SNF2-related protein [Geobacter hydrogenophilus]MBT0893545.1 DEAD/DEAH box helicase [Geobacter hydrogenophilus]GLI37760.1 helicase [Geobacter hydrogenophilus]
MNTPYHAKYFAAELLRRSASSEIDKLSMSLFDASVDLNPHQIEAALFACRSPLSKGVLLADEVGLGKTIEAGLVLCQYWAERRRRLIVICPAALRKQWSLELEEKFNLPSVILEAKSFRESLREGNDNPFLANGIVITSMNFATQQKELLKLVAWDLAVIDEAHKLRNAYRPSNRMGQGIRWALEDRRKLLLTATPLQNSLLELYGLSTLIDDYIFGDLASFREQYTGSDADLDSLKRRLAGFAKRTLRSQVLEYIRYTERRAITRPFRPSDQEQELYEAVSNFLQRADTYAIPDRQRTLTVLIVRKLLASSTLAVAGTLETIRKRLEVLRAGLPEPENLLEDLVEGDELGDDFLDEEEEIEEPEGGSPQLDQPRGTEIDRVQLDAEIAELDGYIRQARQISVDTKTRTLGVALEIGFAEMERMGASRKALIFTESRRTQEYLKAFLEANGYAGRIVLFNGSNTDAESSAIFEEWLRDNADTGRISGSRTADRRSAIIEHFRDRADIMLATEAAAEGVNLQFCSLVINYDLPWNPQRIEQRIGRCHRYGQKHDVVVINFLNERNDADRRVYELLTEKFNLFSGVFGASDEVLGTIETGVDFERRILRIYQECRTAGEIEAAFAALQAEMEQTITSRMTETRQTLLEHFDEDVHTRLKVRLDQTRHHLDRFSRLFWAVTRSVLHGQARFDDEDLTFDLHTPPTGFPPGRYHLISKNRENVEGAYLYRLSHPLGEQVLTTALHHHTPDATLRFDISDHPTKIAMVEALKGKSGVLTLERLTITSFDTEEHLLFSAFTDDGNPVDQEQCEKLFQCRAEIDPVEDLRAFSGHLAAETERHAAATVSRALETSNRHFQEERDKLDKWADDLIVAAEKELKDTKARLKLLNRQARQAITTEEQMELQRQIVELEKKQRRQRQRIFEVEDQIIEKRDALIARLEQQMQQKTTRERLFTVQWTVV